MFRNESKRSMSINEHDLFLFEFEIGELFLPQFNDSNKLISVSIECGSEVVNTAEVATIHKSNEGLRIPLNELLFITAGLTRDSTEVFEEKTCKLYVRYREKGSISGDSVKSIGEAVIGLKAVAKTAEAPYQGGFVALPLRMTASTTQNEQAGAFVYAKITASMPKEVGEYFARSSSSDSSVDVCSRRRHSNASWKLVSGKWIKRDEECSKDNYAVSKASETSSETNSASEEDGVVCNLRDTEKRLRDALIRAENAERRADTLSCEIESLRAQMAQLESIRNRCRRCQYLDVTASPKISVDTFRRAQSKIPPQIKAVAESAVVETVEAIDKECDYEMLFQQHIALKVQLAAEAQDNDESHIKVFELTQQLQQYAERVEELESTLLEMKHWMAEALPHKASPNNHSKFWGGLFKNNASVPLASPPSVLGLLSPRQASYVAVLPPPVSTRRKLESELIAVADGNADANANADVDRGKATDVRMGSTSSDTDSTNDSLVLS